jgi:hypothetical protein
MGQSDLFPFSSFHGTMEDPEELSVHLTYCIPDIQRNDSNAEQLTVATRVHEKHFPASQLPPAGMGLPTHEKPRKVRS